MKHLRTVSSFCIDLCVEVFFGPSFVLTRGGSDIHTSKITHAYFFLFVERGGGTRQYAAF
jgi:hypothetical protein